MADVDQESHPNMPDGEREHAHLYRDQPSGHLTPFSVTTELCRLDAKGTGEFPEYYRDAKQNTRGSSKARKR
jgi:hypothetical protein